ncbi:hypothetical protein DIE14_02355 [Burkholderia sp. Bp9017]|uniref:hypothetical protein n=1 Tax=Burkholderia TaxID=32008 RepID=UPI000F5EF61C|nr:MULTISPECIES: hypothetical protein [unclassified Burkholderia]RQZ31767.1 hypothetical protein DIE14_02355 [Burkholderia sp. Bp9017]RQZ37899.1 hypothetical protein DIE13_02345 [Burkholderia sp. Bp9016]
MECTIGMVLYTACEVGEVAEDTRCLATYRVEAEDGPLWYLLSRCGQLMQVDEGELKHSGMFYPSDERAEVQLDLSQEQDPWRASMQAYQRGSFDAQLRIVDGSSVGADLHGDAV